MTVDDQLSRTTDKWVHPFMGWVALLSNSASAYAATSNLYRNLNATIEQTQIRDTTSSNVGCNSTATRNLNTILNATIGLETYTKNSIEDAISADVIPWAELIDEYAEYRDSHGKANAILRGTSGITSVVSSSIFIWMIMRSHDRLSTTQHRLLLGLCISDIISSLSFSTFNATAPSDNDATVWNAKGNQTTSNAQGFFLTLGMYGGLFYNVSLNLYFLAIVKYKKSDEFIRAKIEPFLHVLPIVLALSYAGHLLAKKHYNNNGEVLSRPINDEPHCEGYDIGEIREGFEIPCYRGLEGILATQISRMILMLIPAVIMMVSLGMIYSAVRTQEKKLARYGVGALRSNLHQQSTSTPQQRTVQDKRSSGMWGRMTMSLTALSISLRSRTWSCKKTNKPVTRSNNVQSQSRAVMQKAFGYTFAWFLSYGLYLIGLITQISTKESVSLVFKYMNNICLPLQGLFNLLIFMHPKIVAAKKPKKRGETVSWCEAFTTAFWSKGKKRNNQGTSRSNLRGRSNRPQRNNRNENAVCGGVKTPMFGGIKKKTEKKRNKAHQEEEKCEIQVPDNLNPNMTRAMYSAASPAIYERNIDPSSSTEITTACDVNLSIDDMVGMKKVDFAENDNGGNALSDIVEDPYEDSMASQDEEEEMNDVEKGSKEIMPLSVAGVNEQKEIPIEHEDEGKEMGADDQA